MNRMMSKLTRWGEAGNWGFVSHLDSGEVASFITQAEAIEAPQQSVFHEMLGLHPMPIQFAPGMYTPLSGAHDVIAFKLPCGVTLQKFRSLGIGHIFRNI